MRPRFSRGLRARSQFSDPSNTVSVEMEDVIDVSDRGLSSPLVRRRRWVVVVAIAAAILSTSGLFASLVIKSPQQMAAEAGEPSATVLTAAVERRVLVDTVVLRGTVTPQLSLDLTPSTARDGGKPVVTSLRAKIGEPVLAGQVIVEVSGRPLIVLEGAIPAYRDLRPGTEGPDVEQLQRGLRTLGYANSDKRGTFGEATKRAVVKFYSDRGYVALTAGEDDEQRLSAGARSVTQAEWVLEDANRALEQARLAAAHDPGPAQTGEVVTAEIAVGRAKSELAARRDELTTLRQRTGAMVPLSELAFLPTMPGRVEKLPVGVGEVVTSPLVRLSSGALSITSFLSPGQRELVDPGMSVKVSAELAGLESDGTIKTIGELIQDDTKGRGYPLTVETSAGLDKKFIGTDVRLEVERARTDDEVLVVPLAAITTTSTGQTIVMRRMPDGQDEHVIVTAGASGAGFVAVTAVSGSLSPGDNVVIGG